MQHFLCHNHNEMHVWMDMAYEFCKNALFNVQNSQMMQSKIETSQSTLRRKLIVASKAPQ